MKRNVRIGLWYLTNCVLVVIFLLPLLSAITVALTPTADLFSSGLPLWPAHPTWDNFQTVWTTVPYLSWYLNSIKVAILFSLGQIFSTSMTAYALVRFRFAGRRVLLLLIVATMMLPFQSLMIPLFILMRDLGWIDTQLPLWVPAFFGDVTAAFGIFLLRQAFLQVPAALADAAMIDGANPWTIFQKVYLPLVGPQLAVVGVFSFMNSWNDFIRPIIYITDESQITVTGGLSYFQTAFHVEWGPLMAGSLLSVLPTLALYVVAQRYFVQAVLTSGVKG